jgi:hypothetical protein
MEKFLIIFGISIVILMICFNVSSLENKYREGYIDGMQSGLNYERGVK